jgi:hypothetical protein
LGPRHRSPAFKEFPPRQKLGSFDLERVMEAVTGCSKQ